MQKTLLKKQCKYCGEEFEVDSNHSNRDRKVFCSRQCFYIFNKWNRSLEERKKTWIRKCKGCGNNFVSMRPKNVCSRICKDRYYGERVRAKKIKDRYKRPLSKKEDLIKSLLDSMFIGFKIDVHNRKIIPGGLELDFLIEPDVAIEYDGRMHFEYIPFMHKTYDKFLERQERDKFKDKWCSDNEISLVRFKFTDIINYDILYKKLEAKIIGDGKMEVNMKQTEENKAELILQGDKEDLLWFKDWCDKHTDGKQFYGIKVMRQVLERVDPIVESCVKQVNLLNEKVDALAAVVAQVQSTPEENKPSIPKTQGGGKNA